VELGNEIRYTAVAQLLINLPNKAGTVKAWTYEKAGVPHLKGDPDYNHKISKLITSTRIPGVQGSPTGFASLFDLGSLRLKDPLLVSSTDGVGTKLEIAALQGRHDTIGIDLVAMCVNDIITCGARPLFFLDYFATGKFNSKTTEEVLKGITKGCREAGCALTGGETAIMPGFYSVEGNGHSQYDVAGFSVGAVARAKLITGEKIRKGDSVLGLASSGFHSNGFSLLRRIFSRDQMKGSIGKELLVPTKIYVKPVLGLLDSVNVKGIINITGGGMIDNIPRVVPQGLGVEINPSSWPVPKLFHSVRDSGNISDFEMFRTFNMGIGMVLIMNPSDVLRAKDLLRSRFKIRSWEIGTVVPHKAGASKVNILF